MYQVSFMISTRCDTCHYHHRWFINVAMLGARHARNPKSVLALCHAISYLRAAWVTGSHYGTSSQRRRVRRCRRRQMWWIPCDANASNGHPVVYPTNDSPTTAPQRRGNSLAQFTEWLPLKNRSRKTLPGRLEWIRVPYVPASTPVYRNTSPLANPTSIVRDSAS